MQSQDRRIHSTCTGNALQTYDIEWLHRKFAISSLFQTSVYITGR